MTPDWNTERQRFPACEGQTYLMTSAVGPLSRDTYEVVSRFQERMMETGDIHYQEGIEVVEQTRARVLRLLGGQDVGSVGFCPNTSHGMNIIALLLKQRGARKILSARGEFPSTTIPFFHQGFEVKQVAADLVASSVEGVDAVVVSSVQFETGLRTDLRALSEATRRLGIPLVVNATQSFGVLPLNVSELGVSALTSSCHKWMCSGYGTSVLYLSNEMTRDAKWPLVGWLSAENPEEMSDQPVPLKQSAAAVETGVPAMASLYALNETTRAVERLGLENIADRVMSLSESFEQEFRKQFPNVRLRSPRDERTWKEDSVNSQILSFEIEGADEWVTKLMEHQVYVSARRGALRVGIHYFNDESDSSRFMEVMKDVLQ